MAQVGITPSSTVRLLCNSAEPLLSSPDAKFFEPGCGDGNFLVEVLARRLAQISCSRSATDFQNTVLLAVANLYGIDIHPVAIFETRHRLQALAIEFVSQHTQPDYRFSPLLEQILEQNFLVADLPRDCRKIVFPLWRKVRDFEFSSTPTVWPAEAGA